MLKIISTKYNADNFRLVREVRDCVFINEQGISAEEESDSYDFSADTDFLVLLEDERPVATMRIAYMPEHIKIGRIAVMKECRGKHYGAVIVSSAVKRIFESGENVVYLESQKHAVGFYEKLGFTVCGDELIDRGIVHLPMIVTPESFKGDKYVKEK